MFRRLRPSTFFVALLMCATGCGSNGSQQTTTTQPTNAQPSFIYTAVNTAPIGSAFNVQLDAFEFDATTNKLSLNSSVPLGSQVVSGIALDPTGKYLYTSAPGSAASFIQRYSIDSATGALQSAGSFNLTQICAFCQPISGPGSLAFAGTGNFLYYGSSSGGAVTQVVGALAVDSTGSLSQVPGAPFPADQTPFLLAVHPAGKFVLTENMNGPGAGGFPLTSISVFVADPNTGALTKAAGSPFSAPANADVVGLAMHPSGSFVYASTGLAANGVLGWALDQTTGALQSLNSSPFLPGAATFGGTFDPTGKFFYASAGAVGGLYGLSVDPNTGALTQMANSPFAQGTVLIGPVVDHSGKYLFAVDTMNKALVSFSIDNTGNLTAVGSPAAMSGIPVALTVR